MQNLSRHLREAIELNSERMPLYAELSDGQTLPFSRKLIRRERYTLFAARFMDRIGDRYQRKGVPFLEKEFVEMSLTPPFSNQFPADINYKDVLQPIDLDSFIKKAKLHVREHDYASLMRHCNALLAKLAEQPHLYCMVRHIIESTYQIASLIPKHEEDSIKLGIKAPTMYSRILIKAHLFTLPESEKFDKDIAPIQNQGIPFIYQDLPAILNH